MFSSIITYLEGKKWAKGDAIRDKGLTIPEELVINKDISYGYCGKWNLLDVYYPKGTPKALPTILNIHGGGFFYGSKELYQYYAMDLAKRGFTVVTINYRLAPHHKFPKQLEDINKAMEWISINAKAYFIDKQNLFLIGDSAGANLTSHYAVLRTNPKVADYFKFKSPEDVSVNAICLNCGFYDPLIRETAQMNFLSYCYAGLKYIFKSKKLEIIRNITKDYYPTYIATFTHDFLRSNNGQLNEILADKGIEHVYRLYGTEEDQQFGHVYHIDIRKEVAKQCNDEECEFFNKHMKGI